MHCSVFTLQVIGIETLSGCKGQSVCNRFVWVFLDVESAETGSQYVFVVSVFILVLYYGLTNIVFLGLLPLPGSDY